MEEKNFSIIGNLRNDRIDGEDRKIVPRHSDVQATSWLDAYNLIIDKAEVVKDDELPSIQTMLAELMPQD